MAFDSSDATAGAGIAASAATGNWVGAALGAVGLGMQVFGGMGQAAQASKISQYSQDEAKQEEGINNAKQQAMYLNAQRTQMQNIRNGQLARANGVNAAVNQGAQFGSGLQGGQAQATDQTLFNMSGVNSALQTGAQINNFNTQIDQDKILTAQAQGTSATDQGIASLGGAVMKAGPVIGAFGASAGGFFGSSSKGNYSGTPGASNTGGLY